MDEKNENDQLLQKFESELKIKQTFQDAQIEELLQNPLKANEERFKLINSMYDLVFNQMNLIRICLTVHSRIVFTEEDGKKLSKEITQIPQQLSDILFESANIRNNLIEITGVMEHLFKRIAKFIKIARHEKLKDKPLDKFLHFIETPKERLRTLLDKTHELDAQKVSTIKKNLVVFMNVSGFKTIPDWITQQAQCKKELKALEYEKQRIFIEDIVECDEVAKIISEMEFYQTQLTGHEHLKEDLQKEKKMLQDHRDLLESQALTSATRSKIVKMFLLTRNIDLDVLWEQKNIVKQEISEITNQENQKSLHEAECKKAYVSLSEKLNAAKEKAGKAKINKEERLGKIDEQIIKKKVEVENFEKKILQILGKHGNPSINLTCLLLESIDKLIVQRTQNTGASASYRSAAEVLLTDIEDNIKYIRDVEGERDLIDVDWIMEFETSVIPIDFLVSEIRPIISNSIHGISPKELAGYSAGKALEPAFNTTSHRIEG